MSIASLLVRFDASICHKAKLIVQTSSHIKTKHIVQLSSHIKTKQRVQTSSLIK